MFYAATTYFTRAERRLWPKLVQALRESVSRSVCTLKHPCHRRSCEWDCNLS
jgi:hypothetical protein